MLGTLIAAYLPHLKSLKIYDAFHDGLNGSAMTEVFFGRLNWLPVMRKLESLKFSDLTLVIDATTDFQIFHKYPVTKLKRLEFSDVQIKRMENPFAISSEIEIATFFIHLKNMFPVLETLVLNGIQDKNSVAYF